MNLWLRSDWQRYIDTTLPYYRSGVRLRFDKDVDSEVKRACKEMIQWLRAQYYFPMRVPIYVRSLRRIRTSDHDLVCGKFWAPCDMRQEPYICIATGDYPELLQKWEQDDALASILGCILHELTHYFQWINGVESSIRGWEWQATFYKHKILSEYAETRDHP